MICQCDSTRQREPKVAGKHYPAPARVSKTSVRRRSSSAMALVAPVTTLPTSSASGCRQLTHNSSSSHLSRRRSRLAAYARGSVVARSASRRFGRPWLTATAADDFLPASCYKIAGQHRSRLTIHFRCLLAISQSLCCSTCSGWNCADAASGRMSFLVIIYRNSTTATITTTTTTPTVNITG